MAVGDRYDKDGKLIPQVVPTNGAVPKLGGVKSGSLTDKDGNPILPPATTADEGLTPEGGLPDVTAGRMPSPTSQGASTASTPAARVLPSFFTPAPKETEQGLKQREIADAVRGYAASGTIDKSGADLMRQAREAGIPENTVRNIYQAARTPAAPKAAPDSISTPTPRLDKNEAMQGTPMGSLISKPTGSRGTPIGKSSQGGRYSAIASGLMGRAAEDRRLNDELRRARIEAFKKANAGSDGGMATLELANG